RTDRPHQEPSSRSPALRARAEINSHFAAGPQARWRGASDELYPGRYVRSAQQSQRACGPQPEGARRRRARIGFVAAPRRCPTSTSSRRLASARPALAPKCEFISARALSSRFHKYGNVFRPSGPCNKPNRKILPVDLSHARSFGTNRSREPAEDTCGTGLFFNVIL